MMDCDGKRAGDTCTLDGGLGTCVPDCDAQCMVCVVPKPPEKPVTAAGGCSTAGGLVLVVVVVMRWIS